jgi:hypothetical protein
MIDRGMRGRPDDRDLTRFAPRVTLTLAAGFLLFLLSAGAYVTPVLLEPVPPGAIPDYRKERVAARLDGKVTYFLFGSLLAAALLSIRGAIPGTSRRPRS